MFKFGSREIEDLAVSMLQLYFQKRLYGWVVLSLGEEGGEVGESKARYQAAANFFVEVGKQEGTCAARQ